MSVCVLRPRRRGVRYRCGGRRSRPIHLSAVVVVSAFWKALAARLSLGCRICMDLPSRLKKASILNPIAFRARHLHRQAQSKARPYREL